MTQSYYYFDFESCRYIAVVFFPSNLTHAISKTTEESISTKLKWVLTRINPPQEMTLSNATTKTKMSTDGMNNGSE